MRWQGPINSVEKRFEEGAESVEVEDIISSRAALVLGIGSFFGSMMFWSGNVTGNAVLNFEKVSANWVGGVLFLLFIVGVFTYVEKRKSDSVE